MCNVCSVHCGDEKNNENQRRNAGGERHNLNGIDDVLATIEVDDGVKGLHKKVLIKRNNFPITLANVISLNIQSR